jgi:spermidine synthase
LVPDSPTVLDRRDGVGGELILRAADGHFEVIANGVFLMDTRNGESERLLIDAAAEHMPPGSRMMIGGLGVGFSLRAAIDNPAVAEIVVVKREPAVIEWNRTLLRPVHGDALADPSVQCVEADLQAWLTSSQDPFGALCLDVDNGPEWTVNDENASLYGGSGLNRLASRLVDGGVLAVWSAAASEAFEHRLRAVFSEVKVLPVPVPRGQPDVVYLGVLT